MEEQDRKPAVTAKRPQDWTTEEKLRAVAETFGLEGEAEPDQIG